MFKKQAPAPITVLMLVTVVAAIATWLLPSGRYSTLSYNENNTFTITSSTGEAVQLPFSQKILDSLHILITADKFKNGDIRKPVSIPGTYKKLPGNKQGIIDVI